MILVTLEKFQAQGLELLGQRIHGEARGNHGAGAAGNLIADQLVIHGRQAALGAHRLADGNKVRGTVEQGAIHIEKNRAQTHQASFSVWSM
ncbi:hypothetical protein D3C71_1975580 [compost metagenome]